MDEVDRALAALADPTRRQVIEALAEADHRTSELADRVGVSVPAVSRHLRILREQGLIERIDVEGDGRGRSYRLDPSKLAVLGRWLDADHWSGHLGAESPDPDIAVYLTRVGGFLDGFAQSDTAFFERHLAPDVGLVFPGSPRVWGRDDTIASVAGHAPYVEWRIAESSIRGLADGLTLVTITAHVRTTAGTDAAPVVQSMVFDDNTDPWTLRFLHQSPAG